MRRKRLLTVNVRDLLRIVNPDNDISPSAIEVWIARECTKSYSIPSVSASLLDRSPSQYFSSMKALSRRAKGRGIDPLDYIPSREHWEFDEEGLWILLDKQTLFLGQRGDVERIRREANHRF